MIKFNISASSYSLYKDSPLVFYYTYILKAPYDTKVNQTYSSSGTIVHNLLEEHSHDENLDVFSEFEKRWHNAGLDDAPGFKGEPLNKNDYENALKYGLKLMDNLYEIIDTEIKYELPFYEDNNISVNLKGFIDFLAKDKKSNICIVDWKTSSSKSDFRIHALMYHLLYYKQNGSLPNRAVYEYLKLGTSTIYTFTLEEVLNFEKELLEFCKFISHNYTKINKFDIGNIDSPFNAHREKCFQEAIRRNNKTPLNVAIKDCYLVFDKLPERLRKIINLKYSYSKDGVFHSEKYKSGQWDGRKYFFKHDCLPYAFVHNVEELLEDYNDKFGTNYEFKFTDYRDSEVMNRKYDTVFKESDIKLRYYQEEAVNMALIKEVGILALGCSAGKTIIAADLIKKLNKKILFLVNRVELAEQTREELENYLGINVGLMTEGELIVEPQIIVASIQTIFAILKRKDSTSIILKDYLKSLPVIIADEIQNLKNSGYYKSVYSNTPNLKYCIGLSGTPFRSQGDSLEMNSLVGFPIYWKSNEALTEEGFLCPSKCLFVNNCLTHDYDEYSTAYDAYIVENEERNKIIANMANKFKDDKKILILTRRLTHAEKLHELIPNSIVITGVTDKKFRREGFESFKTTNGLVLIGSTKIFSAGINIPSLDMIINATAHKSSIDSIQIVGRVKRKFEGKTIGYFIDFLDNGRFFNQASKDRINILKDWGEIVLIVDSVDDEIKP
jgi:superfamily II DNA or RNA helicase